MNRAGGLFYHLRALRAARAGWKPFREALGRYLDEELGATGSLILVGPSAGYCLDDAFLKRFEHVTALEPDAIARVLFARRARRLGIRSLELVARDYLVAPLVDVASGPGLDAFLDARPGATVVFSNVLGQIRFLLPERDLKKWQSEWSKRVFPRLTDRIWATFHDRVSSPVAPSLDMPYRAPRRLSDEELGRSFYAHPSGRVELLDHLTEGLFPAGLPHAYFHWELEPGRHHLVEAVVRGFGSGT